MGAVGLLGPPDADRAQEHAVHVAGVVVHEERKVKRALVSARNDLQLRARRACVLVVVGVRVRGVDVVRWERSFAKVI